MALIEITTNLDEIIALIEEARAAVVPLLTEALVSGGEEMLQELSNAAPKGTGEDSIPPAGDASGRLADSFEMDEESDVSSAHITIRTTQPQKLDWVVNGRGEVLPVTKKALYWKGLAHPVRRAGPSQPNDFVTPVVDAGVERITELFDEALAEIAAQL